MEHEFTYEDLQKVKCAGDKRMEPFLNSWFRMKSRINLCGIPPEYVRKYFYGEIRKSAALAHHIAYYDRLRRGDADKSLEFLERIAQDYADDMRMTKHRADINSAIGFADQPAAASTQVCKFWKKNGACRDGDECPMLHPASGGDASASGGGGGRGNGSESPNKKGGPKGRGRGRGRGGSASQRSKSGSARSPSVQPCYDFAVGRCTRQLHVPAPSPHEGGEGDTPETHTFSRCRFPSVPRLYLWRLQKGQELQAEASWRECSPIPEYIIISQETRQTQCRWRLTCQDQPMRVWQWGRRSCGPHVPTCS